MSNDLSSKQASGPTLTRGDIATALESLRYSIQRISDYPHADQRDKAMSLAPLLSLQDKLRAMRRSAA